MAKKNVDKKQKKLMYGVLGAGLSFLLCAIVLGIFGGVFQVLGLLIAAICCLVVFIPCFVYYMMKSGASSSKESGSVIVPNGTTVIATDQYRKRKIYEVTIPATVKKIEPNAFRDECKINYLGNIGEYLAIDGLDNLPKNELTVGGKPIAGDLVIPAGVKSIPDETFMDFIDITSVTFPKGLTRIGARAFCRCDGITKVTFEGGVEVIEEEAFSFCSAITTLALPVGLKTLERAAFSFCSGLESVTFGDPQTAVGEDAFDHCSALTSITGSARIAAEVSAQADLGEAEVDLTITAEGVAEDTLPDEDMVAISSVKKITFADGITAIEPRMISFYLGLHTVVLPASLKKIEPETFTACYSLAKVSMSEKTEHDPNDFPAGCEIEYYDAVPPRTVKSEGRPLAAPAAGAEITIGNDDLLKDLLNTSADDTSDSNN